jgi:hypothetical protein
MCGNPCKLLSWKWWIVALFILCKRLVYNFLLSEYLNLLAHENCYYWKSGFVGAWAWFPSLGCCEIWDSWNWNKTACSSREPLRISLKMNHGKDIPFGLHVLSKAIMSYHLNWYKLSWVALSCAEWWVRSRKVLVIYRSFSLRTHCFASLKMSGMSITYPR